MAEYIYSKGTRVWFPDKEQGWISAEVTSVTRGTGESSKFCFLDERGKVGGDNFSKFATKASHLFPPPGNCHQCHREGRNGRPTSAEKSASSRDSR